MDYVIGLQHVRPRMVAVKRGSATADTLAHQIVALSSPVWRYIRERDIGSDGHNIVIYRGMSDGAPAARADAFAVEAGAGVLAPFDGNGEVVCSATPSGVVAATRHIGAYHRLPEAHAAIRTWCRANLRAIEGTNWEVYGHWNEDPDKLETDVLYLLR